MAETRQHPAAGAAILRAMAFDLDFEQRYRAVRSRDAQFDGWFFTAVTSTGIYCRPSCPAATPRSEHVRFYPTAAAAQAAGFRACKRCVPGAVPGSPAWDLRADLAGRAMHLIADGVVERDGVPGLAARLGYSERQVRRHLTADLGAGPLALARAQRAHVARLLLETTDLPVTEVAFAAGFGSLRQFNATIREVFAAAPTDLRAARRPGGPAPAGRIELRLARRSPFAWDALLAFLAVRAVPGVEEVVDGTFRRSLALPHGPAIVELTDAGGAVRCTLALADPRDLGPAVARCPAPPRPRRRSGGRGRGARGAIRSSPISCGSCPAGAPRGPPTAPSSRSGRCSGRGSRWPRPARLAGRLVAAHGTPLPAPARRRHPPLPCVAAIAAADPAALPGPPVRRAALRGVARALADDGLRLDPGATATRRCGGCARSGASGPGRPPTSRCARSATRRAPPGRRRAAPGGHAHAAAFVEPG